MNPFNLYMGKEDIKESNKCTRELKKAFKGFIMDVRVIRDNFEEVGASDTESREDQVSYFIKQMERLY